MRQYKLLSLSLLNSRRLKSFISRLMKKRGEPWLLYFLRHNGIGRYTTVLLICSIQVICIFVKSLLSKTNKCCNNLCQNIKRLNPLYLLRNSLNKFPKTLCTNCLLPTISWSEAVMLFLLMSRHTL